MRILVTGAGGQVGARCVAAATGHEVLAADRQVLDIADRLAVDRVVADFRPDAIVNCAAMTDVDGCERDPDAAYAHNALGPRHLALAASAVGAHLVHVSTDYVFDGTGAGTYREWDAVNPISTYGRSKLGGEQEVAALAPTWAIARTSWVFGRPGGDFPSWVVKAAHDGTLTGIVSDQFGSPTYADDLAGVLVAMAERRTRGLFHVANAGRGSRHAQGERTLAALGRPADVAEIAAAAFVRPAARPADSSLDSRTLRDAGLPPMRPWEDALDEYVVQVLAPRLDEVVGPPGWE